MLIGPLAMGDLTSLTLLKDIFASIVGDGSRTWVQGLRAQEALAKLVNDFDRKGRAAGGGIYDYQEKPPTPFAAINNCFPPIQQPLSDSEVEQRLTYAQALEAARCVEEGIVGTAQEADIGSILAWAFPSYVGGVLGLIDTIGVEDFVAQCDELKAKFGGRFDVPAWVREKASNGETLCA